MYYLIILINVLFDNINIKKIQYNSISKIIKKYQIKLNFFRS